MSKFQSAKNKSLAGSQTMNPSNIYRKYSVRGHVYTSFNEWRHTFEYGLQGIQDPIKTIVVGKAIDGTSVLKSEGVWGIYLFI